MSAMALSGAPTVAATGGSRTTAGAVPGDAESCGGVAGILGEAQAAPPQAAGADTAQRPVEPPADAAGRETRDANAEQCAAGAESAAAQVAALLGLVPTPPPPEAPVTAGGALEGLAALLTARPRPMAAPQGLQLPPGEALSEGISLLAESRLESGAGALTAGVLLPFEAVTALQGQGGSELPSQSTSTPTPGGAGFIDALSGLRATPASGGTAPPGGGVLQSPLGSAPWRDELGGRLTLMLDRGEQFATLQLTPEDLGPLEIRIALREGEATVWFGSQAPEARAAIEQALPRLRELFAAGGLSLADAGVFSGSPEDPQRSRSASSLARAARESGDDAGMQVAADPRVRRGLLDLYA